MAEKKIKPIVFDEARIVFRNFTGLGGLYNREGDRNFCLMLTQEEAASMVEEGWNVKYLKPREEDDLPQPYLQVKVQFGKYPPRIVLITSRGRTDLDEGKVSLLDWAEIKRVDLTIRPYEWLVSGKTGVKAYLKNLYVTVEEDKLEMRYMDVPDSASNAMSFEPNFSDMDDDED